MADVVWGSVKTYSDDAEGVRIAAKDLMESGHTFRITAASIVKDDGFGKAGQLFTLAVGKEGFTRELVLGVSGEKSRTKVLESLKDPNNRIVDSKGEPVEFTLTKSEPFGKFKVQAWQFCQVNHAV